MIRRFRRGKPKASEKPFRELELTSHSCSSKVYAFISQRFLEGEITSTGVESFNMRVTCFYRLNSPFSWRDEDTQDDV